MEKDGRYVVNVMDLFGGLVAEKVVNSSFGQIEARINAISVASGTYLVMVTSEDESYKKSHLLVKE